MGEIKAPADISPLFRPESIVTADDRFGTPIRPASVASWMLVAFMALLLASSIIFLCTTSYARRETVIGSLQPATGALRVSSMRPAVVAAISVREGDKVSAGQPLITLTLDPTMSGGRRLGDILSAASDDQGAALARLETAQRDLVGRQRDEVAAKRAALLEQQRRLFIDANLQGQRVALAGQTADAARTLWNKQLMSGIQYRQREEALIVAQQGLAAIERDLAALPSSLAELTAADRRLMATQEEIAASAASNRSLLQEKRASTQAESQVVLTAQRSGRIAALQAKPGATVSAGQALALVLPEGVALQAELWVPSRAAGFVRAGNKVRLMYDAFPYQRFGVGRGQVIEVSRAPTAPNDLPAAIKTDEALYRVVVALETQSVRGYGQTWQLAPGMRLTADMVLEQQTLFLWLFDKLRAASKRAQPL